MPESPPFGGCLPRTHEMIKNYSVWRTIKNGQRICRYPFFIQVAIPIYRLPRNRLLIQSFGEGQDHSLRGAVE